MIDIHLHILPGLDDGAEEWDSALRMARMAADSGVTAVAATPHCSMRFPHVTAQVVLRSTERLQEMLRRAGINLRVYPGMEILGDLDTGQLLQEGIITTINNSRYPLIEFHFHGDGQEETEILDSVLQCGYRPVIAHPERYLYVQQDPELLSVWTEMGCLLQVNRGSLLGRFGQRAAALAYAMIERGYAAVVASDGHSPEYRTPWMADVWEFLCEEFSSQTADLLLEDNPGRILRDQSIRLGRPDWF